MTKCRAILGVQYRCKIPILQKCQQSALDGPHGLCGIHTNALKRGDLQVVATLSQTKEEPEMDHAARVAFINAQIACLNAEVAGMVAENQQRAIVGHSPAYTHADFIAAMNGYYVSHNAVIEYLRDDQ